jgi:predicted RNA binding protein YcfA (HicA-like mRNA interferase family)
LLLEFDDIVLKWYYIKKPRKIRELEKDLKKTGFADRGGKGSHRNFIHVQSGVVITLCGNLGDDAKPYQEKILKQKIKESQG